MPNCQRRCSRCGRPLRGCGHGAPGNISGNGPAGIPGGFPDRIEGVGPTIVTDKRDCCMTPESPSEELYAGIKAPLLVYNCCDSVSGCHAYDARRRNPFWPSFAHPRWLPCEVLYNRR